MNEAEVTRMVADALRDAHQINTIQAADAATKKIVEDTLWDVAYAMAQEVWPNRSEESPVMPEEWAEASKGR